MKACSRSPKSCSCAILFISLAVFGVSCVSAPSGTRKAPPDSSFVRAQQIQRSACFSPKLSHGSQFTSILQGAGIPDVNFEGAWENNFHVFLAQVVSPLGEELATLRVQSEPQKAELSDADPTQQKTLEPIVSFLDIIGPENIRVIACGLHAGSSDVYQKKSSENFLPSGKTETYYTKTKLIVGAKAVKLSLDNEIFVNQQPGFFALRIDSKVSGGPFGMAHVARLSWQGTVRGSHFQPDMFDIFTNDAAFRLTFSSFD